MHEEDFELTFDLEPLEPAPQPAPAAPAVPVPRAAAPQPRPQAEQTAAPAKTAAQPSPTAPARPAAEEAARPSVSVRGAEKPAPRQDGTPHSPARGVLISGGDRGIGAAAARAFYQAGYRVAVLYHTNAEAAASLEADLPGLIALQCDVASRAACESAFTAAEIMLGHVDVLVCNAGIAQQKLFTDITPAEWQHMLDVNLTGAFHLCQLALPGMIRRKWGRILTVSSMWGQTGGSCCVAPGVIDTDMMAAFTPGDKAALAEETPVGRLGSAQEVARALLFLAGEEAGYITGQVFGVNGGLVI